MLYNSAWQVSRSKELSRTEYNGSQQLKVTRMIATAADATPRGGLLNLLVQG